MFIRCSEAHSGGTQHRRNAKIVAYHQQPEVNYLPRFSPQVISLERYTQSVYRAGEIDLFENLDIVHIRSDPERRLGWSRCPAEGRPDCRSSWSRFPLAWSPIPPELREQLLRVCAEI